MKIIKKYQGTVPDNKILDTYSTSNTDTYSCNYVNNTYKNLVTYSSGEQLIGKWIDNRNLYRVIFTGSDSTQGDHAVIGNVIGNYNIKDVVRFSTTIKDAQGRRMTPYYYDAGSNVDYYNCWIEYHDGSIHTRYGSSFPVRPVSYIIILEYTKNS